MKLNTQGLNELRKKVEEQLLNVPDGQRVHIDKELLDDLIFFKGKNKDGRVIKVPVWTGQFLRKIDLSEISFENVFFQIGYDDVGYSIDKVMDAEDVSRFVNIGNDRFPDYRVPGLNKIDFSYTNANIDFSKICGTVITRCNFEGLDLSKANGECITHIFESNFSNTNIKINFNHRNFIIKTSDFSNNDFSYITVDAKWFNDEDRDFHIYCSNFSDTGLKINYTSTNIPPIFYEAIKKNEELREMFQNKNISEEKDKKRMKKYDAIISKYFKDYWCKYLISEEIKKNHFNGCYINGKKVLPLEERQAIAQEKKAEYEKMKEDLIASTINSIEQQASGLSRK